MSLSTKHIYAYSVELMVMANSFSLKARKRGVREQLKHSFLHLSTVY